MTDTQPEVYDPSDHNADEVLAYLADAPADEAERVLQAEAAGKARKTVLDSTVAAAVEDVQPPSVAEQLAQADPYEMVRARSAGDAPFEYSTTRVAALSAGSTILDKPARDEFGALLPHKPVVDLAAETDAAADDQSGDDTKEN